jgi:hypothetical protein
LPPGDEVRAAVVTVLKGTAAQDPPMDTTTAHRTNDRTRAMRRLRAMTVWTALAGLTATGGFGWLAAATHPGTTTTVASVVTTTGSSSSGTSSTSSTTAAAATASPSTTSSGSSSTTSSSSVSSSAGQAQVSTGGS